MRHTIRWLCRSLIRVKDDTLSPSIGVYECGYTWIAPKVENLIPKCPRCSGIRVVKLEEYTEKAPLQ